MIETVNFIRQKTKHDLTGARPWPASPRKAKFSEILPKLALIALGLAIGCFVGALIGLKSGLILFSC